MKTKAKKRLQTINQRDLFDMSESDEEYFPEKEEECQSLGKRKEFNGVKAHTKNILREMREEVEGAARKHASRVTTERSFEESKRIELCHETIGELTRRIKPTKEGLIHFAGKTYKLSDDGELVDACTTDIKKGFEELQQLAKKYTEEEATGKNSQAKVRNLEESEYRHLLKEKKTNLRTLIGLLNNRHRNVSAIFKSRIDWKRFTAVNQLDKQLAQNRKDGFIEKQKFLVQSSTLQKKV